MSSRISALRDHLDSPSDTTSITDRSLSELNNTAAHPPQRIRRPPMAPQRPLVLYFFRVPGSLDLCLSTARPAADIVTDIDIASSLYYVRIINNANRLHMVLVRRNPATNGNKEVALMLDPQGHIDVFENDYKSIEARYWQSNRQDSFTLASSFGCYIRESDEIYTMSTPWAGLCHFSTIRMGNALKGIHSLQHFEGGPSAEDLTVSELRFNFMASKSSSKARRLAKRASVPLPMGLPRRAGSSHDHALFQRLPDTADMATSVPATSPHIVGGESTVNKTAPGHSSSQPLGTRIRRKPVSADNTSATSQSFSAPMARHSLPDLAELRLDLSLGQEKLGGGFDGEQAKLAKLIVEAEGESMLDLLVAANIVLFRRAFALVA